MPVGCSEGVVGSVGVLQRSQLTIVTTKQCVFTRLASQGGDLTHSFSILLYFSSPFFLEFVALMLGGDSTLVGHAFHFHFPFSTPHRSIFSTVATNLEYTHSPMHTKTRLRAIQSAAIDPSIESDAR